MKLLPLPVLLSALLGMAANLCAAQVAPFPSPTAALPIVRSSVLPVDEAFALTAIIEAPDHVILLWDIQDGYYLYRKSIAASGPDGAAIDLGELAEGILEHDEYFGDVYVYYERLLLKFPLAALVMKDNAVTFTLQYQGCAKDRYCYPGIEREITLTLPE